LILAHRCQETDMTAPSDATASIRLMLDRYRDCVLAKDPAGLLALYRDDVRVFDLWDAWSHDGLPAWRASVEGWLGSLGDETVRVAFDDVRIEAGERLASASFVTTYAAMSPTGEVLRSMHNRGTWALARAADGGWRIFHEHTSAPIRSRDIKGVLQRPSAG
jgi:uncharacterized protein (TIGR02246 family)